MLCTICNKPIVLVPSAAERSAKYGQPASFYTSLFRQHTECQTGQKSARDNGTNRQTDGSDRIRRGSLTWPS